MPEMTIHQRMMAVYRGELPDQFPVSIYSGYLPRGSCERMLREMGLGVIDYHPIVTMLAPPWHTHEGFISEVKGVDLDISFTWQEGEKVEVRTYKTPVGTISEHIKKDPSYGSDWISKFYVTEIEHYKILQYIVERTVFRKNDQGLRSKMKNLGQDGVCLGRLDRTPYQKLLIELAGPERFLMDLYTDPEPVTALIDAMDRRMDEAIEMALDTDAEVIWQPDNVTVDMTPPNNFKKYSLAFYKKHVPKFKASGRRYLVHMDGRLKALKDLIADAPFDVVESFSYPEIGGDLLLPEARAAWPNKVILPNFPSSLCHQSDEKIEAFLDKMLTEAGKDKPFMLQVSEDIPASEWQRALPILCRFMNANGKINN